MLFAICMQAFIGRFVHGSNTLAGSSYSVIDRSRYKTLTKGAVAILNLAGTRNSWCDAVYPAYDVIIPSSSMNYACPHMSSSRPHPPLSDKELSSSGSIFRELLPAPVLNFEGTSSDSSQGPSLPRLLSRANVTKIACEPCRKRKAKCCGERPKCKACINKGLECHYQASSRDLPVLKRKYNEIQEKVNIYERLYDLLMNVPEQDSHAILGKLREGPDVATTILQVDDGDLLLQLASASETRLCKGQAVENLSNWLRGVLPSRGGGLSALATPGSHDANLGDASASAPAGGTSGAASCPLSLEHEKATSSNPDAKVMSSSEGRRGPSQSRIRSWAEGMQNDHMPDRLPQSHGLDHVPSTLDQRDLELYPPAWTTITNDMHLILHLLALYKGRSDDPMAGISARRGWKWLWTEN
ncbi:hypothetical protein FOBRF1_013281 [Fusarium oxysporum]